MIGIHINDINYIYKSNKKIFQIFINEKISNDKKFINHIKNNDIIIIVHVSYSINLSKNWSPNSSHILQLINEIKYAHKIGSPYIVIHTGKQMDKPLSVAINNMYSSLLHILSYTKNVKILLETPSGQGTETLTDIKDFCNFVKKFNDKIGICIDTCHIFVAGNDIRTQKNINNFFEIIDKTVGINKVKLCHLNDSKNKLGSRIDRHEKIGKGYIGQSSLNQIIKFLEFIDVPMINEF